MTSRERGKELNLRKTFKNFSQVRKGNTRWGHRRGGGA